MDKSKQLLKIMTLCWHLAPKQNSPYQCHNSASFISQNQHLSLRKEPMYEDEEVTCPMWRSVRRYLLLYLPGGYKTKLTKNGPDISQSSTCLLKRVLKWSACWLYGTSPFFLAIFVIHLSLRNNANTHRNLHIPNQKVFVNHYSVAKQASIWNFTHYLFSHCLALKCQAAWCTGATWMQQLQSEVSPEEIYYLEDC